MIIVKNVLQTRRKPKQKDNLTPHLSCGITDTQVFPHSGLCREATLTYPVALLNVTTTPTDVAKINIYKALDKEAEVGSDQRLSASGINGTNTKTSNLRQTRRRSLLCIQTPPSALRITFLICCEHFASNLLAISSNITNAELV